MYRWLWLFISVFLIGEAQAISAKDVTRQSKTYRGLFTLYYPNRSGDTFIEVKKFKEPFLLVTSVVDGAGVGISAFDKESTQQSRLVQFERYGSFIVLKQLNEHFHDSVKTHHDYSLMSHSVARSILWKGKTVSGKSNLAHATDLFTQNIQPNLTKRWKKKKATRRAWQLVPKRSSVIANRIITFPKNLDVDVMQTFHTTREGFRLKNVIPDAHYLSLVVRFSFIPLPKTGFRSVLFDPQSGFDFVVYQDDSLTLEQPNMHRLQQRYRLSTSGSITFYVDPSIPKVYQKTILEGIQWWKSAFSAAGFSKAITAKILPKGKARQDIRHNLITWKYGAFEGKSAVSKIVDPTTGEIIRSLITIDDMQIRQVNKFARGLTAGWKERSEAKNASDAFTLQRLKLLTAYSVGRALGLSRNLAGSTLVKGSVMDLPFPLLKLEQGEIDLSQAFQQELGDWEKFAINLGYNNFSSDKKQALLVEAWQQGLRYLAGIDGMLKTSSNIFANAYDVGMKPMESLANLNKIRDVAQSSLNRQALLTGQSDGELRDILSLVYLMNWYQVQSVIRIIGGTEYDYSNNNESPWAWAAPEYQTQALSAVLGELQPNQLMIDDKLLQRLTMRAPSYHKNYRMKFSKTGVVFDHLGLSEIYARLILRHLLEPSRLNRLFQASRNDIEQMSVDDVISKLFEATVLSNEPSDAYKPVWYRTNFVVVDTLFKVAESRIVSPEVVAMIEWQLEYLYNHLTPRASRTTRLRASHYTYIQRKIQAWRKADSKHKPRIRLIEHPARLEHYQLIK